MVQIRLQMLKRIAWKTPEVKKKTTQECGSSVYKVSTQFLFPLNFSLQSYCVSSHRSSPNHKSLNPLIQFYFSCESLWRFFGFRDEVNWGKCSNSDWKVFLLTPTLVCLFLWVAWVRTGAISSLQSSLTFMMLITYIGCTTGSMSGACLPVATSPLRLCCSPTKKKKNSKNMI